MKDQSSQRQGELLPRSTRIGYPGRVNLLLFEKHEIDEVRATARITGRRAEQLKSVQRFGVGDVLRIGRVEGPLGEGRVLSIDTQSAEIAVTWNEEPPPPLPVELVLALPRPPILRRTLYNATQQGVKKIHLVASARVDKSYWQSRSLRPAALREQLLLGLEQARDTRLPTIELHRHFRPFAETRLPELVRGRPAWVAHPGSKDPCPASLEGPLVILVGPEGGFKPFEIESFEKVGVRGIDLGPRLLRVDTAVTALLARVRNSR